MYGSSGTPTWTMTFRPSGSLALCSTVLPRRLTTTNLSSKQPQRGLARCVSVISGLSGDAGKARVLLLAGFASEVIRRSRDAATRAGGARTRRLLSAANDPDCHRDPRRLVHHPEGPLDLPPRPLLGLHRALPRARAQSGGQPRRAPFRRPARRRHGSRLDRNANRARPDRLAVHPDPLRPGHH